MQKLVSPLVFCLSSLSLFSAPVFHVNQPRLPDAMVGKVYAGGPLVVEGGGQCPRNQLWVRLVGGALPAGMYLSAAGQFGGLPMEAGSYEFVVRVENGCGWSDQAMTLEVIGAPIMLANPASLEFRVIAGQPVAPAAIQVSSNRAGQPYTVDSSAPWLRARPRAGRTPSSGSALSADLVDLEIDTASLLPGQHRASLDIGGWRMGPVSVPVRVEVLSRSGAPGPTQSMVEQTGGGNWAGPVMGSVDPRLPRLALGEQQHQQQAGPGRGEPPPAQPVKGRSHAAPAGRMSRSANLRSKYLSSKASGPAGSRPSPAAAHTPPAAEHSKPSPVGEPVKKADAHGKPADAHGKPTAGAHGKPADAHGKPADAHGKPAAGAHGKPADAHGKPADAHGKPADAHGKPADAHGKPAAGAHGKPADAHGKPADAHGKPADAHGKPKEAAKH